jgi:hypothetical protein
VLGLLSAIACFVMRSFRDWQWAGVLGAASLAFAGVLTVVGSRWLGFSLLFALWTNVRPPLDEADHAKGFDLWSAICGVALIAGAIVWLVWLYR